MATTRKRKPKPKRKYPPEPLTQPEIQALCDACSRRAPTSVRNRALIIFLWRTGARIGEALALRPTDIDIEGRQVRILSGKGDRQRTVAIDDGALVELQVWMGKRERALREHGVKTPGRATLFCTLAGGKVSTAYIRAMLPRLGRRAGLTRRIHAHALRHSLASDLANEGKNAYTIQGQLGHSRMSTTDRYLAKISAGRLVEEVGSREWSFDHKGACRRSEL